MTNKSASLLAACLFLPPCLVAEAEIIETTIAPATAANPRNSEADIIELKDGSLLVGWSEFYGGAGDAAAARIAAARSTDGGRSWSPRFVLQDNAGRLNVMDVSFLRSRSGDLLFFFLRKNSMTDLKLMVRRSSDEARTWDAPLTVTPEDGYHIAINGRIIQLRTGRLLAPISTVPESWAKGESYVSTVYFSDDDGRTWKRSPSILTAPQRGAMEPGLIELQDGRLMQIMRTQTGYIWHSYSADAGETWSPAAPWNIQAPESPSTLVRVPETGGWILVWNPQVAWLEHGHVDPAADHAGPRTPLVAALSHDEGRTWTSPKPIESDPSYSFAYTSVTFCADRVLLTYYARPDKTDLLTLKFKSVPLSWFYDR